MMYRTTLKILNPPPNIKYPYDEFLRFENNWWILLSQNGGGKEFIETKFLLLVGSYFTATEAGQVSWEGLSSSAFRKKCYQT